MKSNQNVDEFVGNLDVEIQPVVNYLRSLMLSIHQDIGEQIKWNSPAFYYKGEMKETDAKTYPRDILVLHLRKNKILCILPTGIKIKTHTKLLEGDYTDGRRMINFKDLDDVSSKENDFKELIIEWLSLIEKN